MYVADSGGRTPSHHYKCLGPCVRRGQFALSLHSSGTRPTCLRSGKKRADAPNATHLNGIFVSPSLRQLLTQFGDAPKLRKERSGRPLLTHYPCLKLYQPTWASRVNLADVVADIFALVAILEIRQVSSFNFDALAMNLMYNIYFYCQFIFQRIVQASSILFPRVKSKYKLMHQYI